MAEQEYIVMYGTPWCPDCVRAKSLLDQQGAPYRWIDIQDDPQAAAVVAELNDGMRSVPTIVFPHGSVLVEPSNAELLAELGRRS
jgi:mycoredoxin